MTVYYKGSPKSLLMIEGVRDLTYSLDNSEGITTLHAQMSPLPEGVSVISKDEADRLLASDAYKSAPPEVIDAEEVDYASMRVAELRALCRDRDIEGYSDMRKAELVAVLSGE